MADITIRVQPNRAFSRFQQEGGRRLKRVQQDVIKRATFDVEAEAKRNVPVVEGH